MPIGTRENPFTGHLESTGAVVSNLTIRGDRDGQGLVGVMEHGRLSSVTLESVDVEGRSDVIRRKYKDRFIEGAYNSPNAC